MNKKILIQLIILCAGCMYSLISFKVSERYDVDITSFKIIDKPHTFLNIISNNLIVGLFISIGGYLSAGFLVLIILFWNSFFLTEIIQSSLVLNISTNEILYGLVYHGPIEILAFLLFGKIGLDGLKFYSRIFKKNKIALIELKNIKSFLPPVILLIVSAVIESNL